MYLLVTQFFFDRLFIKIQNFVIIKFKLYEKTEKFCEIWKSLISQHRNVENFFLSNFEEANLFDVINFSDGLLQIFHTRIMKKKLKSFMTITFALFNDIFAKIQIIK